MITQKTITQIKENVKMRFIKQRNASSNIEEDREEHLKRYNSQFKCCTFRDESLYDGWGENLMMIQYSVINDYMERGKYETY